MSDSHITAKTEFISANGVRYAYRKFGSGYRPPIVCLQHFRGGLDNWDPLVTDGLAKEGPIILFNNSGIASSEGEPDDTIVGTARHVSDFVNALGLEKINVLGLSMGGFAAQQLAADRPDLIHRLILAGTGPEGGEAMVNYPPLTAQHATREVPTEADFLYLFFSPTPASQAAGRAYWERRHLRADQDVPSSLAAMRAQATANAAWGVVPDTCRYAQLEKLELPVLVINGKEDVVVPTVNSYVLQQHLPNATLIIYPDSGHGSIFQFPEAFVRDANLFLNS